MGKQVFHGKESREKLLEGVNELANAVKVTLGPRGRNVIIQKDSAPHITKDGVTVAKSIEFSDAAKNLGAQVIKETAQQTADHAGDGTTTSTVLAQSIFNQGMDVVELGANPILLRRGMGIAVAEITKMLTEEISIKVEDNEQVKQVATISANGDSVIGGMIADAVKEVGRDGVITVEEGNSNEDELEIVEGLQFGNGYLSHYFINNQTKLNCVIDEPVVLLYDGKISTMDQIIHILEAVSTQSKPILVVAHDVEGEALATMVVNSVRGTLRALAVKAPGFGSERTEILRDMAALLGGKMFGTIDAELEDATLEDLGSCDKVVSNKKETTLIGGHGNAEALKLRIEQIKNEISEQKSDFEKEKLHKRLSKLSGGVAVIRVGAQSEVEMKEKKDLFDDALLATKAALEEGIVAGGGAALYHCSKDINQPKSDEQLGYAIVMKACKSPMEAILKNAGLDHHKVFGLLDANYTSDTSMGYDVVSEHLVNMIEKGIIDPTKVTRIAIEKAVSVAGTLLTTECMIVEEPAEKESDPKS